MRKTQTLMNKLVYLDLLILDLSKTAMYQFWHIYVKPKYDKNAKLCYISTGSLMVHVKTNAIYETIEKILKQDLTRLINCGSDR